MMKMDNFWKVNRDKKVLCVGLMCLDIISVCEGYPLEGTDQNCKSLRWQKGGNAANTSGVLGMLGQTVEYFGTVSAHSQEASENVATEYVEAEMKKYHVIIDNVIRIPDSNCPCSHVIVNFNNGSRTILHNRKALPELTFDNFASLDLSLYSLIHFEARNLEEVLRMIDHVHEYNHNVKVKSEKILISVELEKARRPNLHLMLPKADLVVISEDYARAHGHSDAVVAVEAYKLLTKSGAFVVCAWGSSGAASGVSKSQDDVIMTPAFSPDQVTDTLGAGDTFLGALIFSLLRERSLPESVKFACHVAGHKVGHYGYDNIRGMIHDFNH